MKYVLFLIFSATLINANSQNISVLDLERVIKKNLNETDLALNKLGLTYVQTEPKESENCQTVIWSNSEKCKTSDCLFAVRKEFCETEPLFSVVVNFFNSTYFNSYKTQLEKNGYTYNHTYSDNNGLHSDFVKERKYYVVITRHPLDKDNSSSTLLTISMFTPRD